MQQVTLTGKLLRCRVTEEPTGARVDFLRACAREGSRDRFSRYATHYYGTYIEAKESARSYLLAVERLTDAEIKET